MLFRTATIGVTVLNIRDFDRLAEKTRTAQELYDKMLELYPNRVNRGWALWSSARAFKPLSQAAENAK
jgi:hypothetical protein